MAVLLALCLLLPLATSLHKTCVYDESFYITGGFIFAKTGEVRNLETSAASTAPLLAALPLLLSPARLPAGAARWVEGDMHAIEREFLFHNALPAEQILLLGRLPILLLSVLLGWGVYRLGRRLLGAPAALIALALYAFCPLVTSFASVATSDLAAACFFFWAVAAFHRQLERPGWRSRLLTGLVTGLALNAKFTALFLPPLFALLYLAVHRAALRPGRGLLRASLSLVGEVGAPVLLGLGGVFAVYAFSSDPLGYWHSFLGVLDHLKGGHPAYLNGELSSKGWWTYYPVALAVKTPLPLLLGGVGWLLLAALRDRRAVPKGLVFLWLPPLFLFGCSLASPVNMGIRHLLPLYPFLILLAGWTLAQLAEAGRAVGRLAAAAGVAWAAAAWVAVYPYDLTYFNEAAGGPRQGHRFLLDSNLDWGQDLGGLGEWIRAHQIHEIRLDYFGTAEPAYYRIPTAGWPADLGQLTGHVAVSVNFLQGLYLADPHRYDFLKRQEPVAMIGNTLYVYHLPPTDPGAGGGTRFD